MKEKRLNSQSNPFPQKDFPDTKKKSEDELVKEAIDRLAELFYQHALIRLKERRKNQDKKL